MHPVEMIRQGQLAKKSFERQINRNQRTHGKIIWPHAPLENSQSGCGWHHYTRTFGFALAPLAKRLMEKNKRTS